MGKSWNTECPVPLADLAYIQVSHWKSKDKAATGELIFHKNPAQEITEIFLELFQARYPIAKMVLIDDYNADDELSMADNNSSAFCSRAITGKPDVFSLHSYGGTIDINPKTNPYVKGNVVLPKGSERYLDRNLDIPELIKEGTSATMPLSKGGTRGAGTGDHLRIISTSRKIPKNSSNLRQ